jgi:hypothetical protein
MCDTVLVNKFSKTECPMGYGLAVQPDLHQEIAGNSKNMGAIEYFSIIYYSKRKALMLIKGYYFSLIA